MSRRRTVADGVVALCVTLALKPSYQKDGRLHGGLKWLRARCAKAEANKADGAGMCRGHPGA